MVCPRRRHILRADYVFNEAVVHIFSFQSPDEFVRIAGTDNNGCTNRCSREVESLLFPPVHAADIQADIWLRVLLNHESVCRTRNCLHDKAGGTDDVTGTGTYTKDISSGRYASPRAEYGGWR